MTPPPITADDINTWKDVALAAIAAAGVVLVALVGMVFTVIGLIKTRMSELHAAQQATQGQVAALAAIVPPSAAAPAKTTLSLNHEKLAAALAPTVAKAIKSLPSWPPASEALPPRNQ